MLGVKDFVRRGWAERVTAAIVCEPEDNRICIAQKGVMWVDVRTTGKMAHGAMPFTGVNPITRMARFLAGVEDLEAQYIAQHGKHVYLGSPSISPTRIHAPEQEHGTNNVIPATCRATLDIRLIPGQSPKQVMDDLNDVAEATAERYDTFKIEFTLVDVRPPTETPQEEPLVQALAEAVHAVTGKSPVYGGVPGSTDGTILADWAGIPVVTCGPGNTFLPHQVDEYLDIDQLLTAARLYVVAAMRYLGVAEAGE